MSWHGYEPDCICEKCVKYGKDLESGGMAYADRRAREGGSGSKRGRGRAARAIVSGAITVAGATADAGKPPNTEQLNESYTQQMERRRREALDDANNDQS